MKKFSILIFTLLLFNIQGFCLGINYDSSAEEDIQALFKKGGKSKYVLKFVHEFKDTLYIPTGSELCFKGGALKGPIVFDNVLVSGNVRLQGSSVSGYIRNKVFDASWICYKDGITDDARYINEIVKICGNIFFPKGNYMLLSEYYDKELPDELHSSIKTHIGISRSNVTLRGEPGTEFVTDMPLSIITIYSQPNNIGHSVSNIRIENITFSVHNDGDNFNEFVHSIKIVGNNGLILRNCTFNDFWGDAICLGHYGDTPSTGERTRNQNVLIYDNTIIGGNHHNNRNGISIINGKNVKVEKNRIVNTSRKDMPGGVDIEPNNSAYTIDNISIVDNEFNGIRGDGGAIQVAFLRDNASGRKIKILSNRIYNCSIGITVAVRTESTTSDFVIKDNYIAKDTKPYVFIGEGTSRDWEVSRNTFGQPCIQSIPGKIKVGHLVVKKNKKKVL